MKKKIEIILFLIALATTALAIVVAFWGGDNNGIANAAKYIAAVAAFNFFMYKVFTGWLFINLTLKAETERTPNEAGTGDHLTIKTILVKGAIDSLWLEDIQIRLSTLHDPTNPDNKAFSKVIRPLNFQKIATLFNPLSGKYDAWNGDPGEFYILSSSEETFFSAYDTVPSGTPISIEIVVIGTRPFYTIERKKRAKIQWRASLIKLPVAGSQ